MCAGRANTAARDLVSSSSPRRDGSSATGTPYDFDRLVVLEACRLRPRRRSARKTCISARGTGVAPEPHCAPPPPLKPVSSASSRFAAAIGCSPSSSVPAGSSNSFFRAASRSCLTSAIPSSTSTATIATAPGRRRFRGRARSALDRHVDEVAVVDGARCVRLQLANRSTSARSSAPTMAARRSRVGARMLRVCGCRDRDVHSFVGQHPLHTARAPNSRRGASS